MNIGKLQIGSKLSFPTNGTMPFEGMLDDMDSFLDGWFAVRKIKGRHKPKEKIEKGPDENNRLLLTLEAVEDPSSGNIQKLRN